MDLGATVCARTKPRCEACPLDDCCIARTSGRTGDLPAARPRREVPLRHATLLVLLDGDRVLLETRPPTGIWGGLQSLPELPEGADAQDWAEQHFACRVVAVSPAPTLVHAFSHFRLHITPLRMRVETSPHAMEAGQQWLALDALDAAALPAPIRRILEQIGSAEGIRQHEGQDRDRGEQH
jgi:A/G-specific adenine glycosylase